MGWFHNAVNAVKKAEHDVVHVAAPIARALDVTASVGQAIVKGIETRKLSTAVQQFTSDRIRGAEIGAAAAVGYVAAPVVASVGGGLLTAGGSAAVSIWDKIRNTAGGVFQSGVDAAVAAGKKALGGAIDDAAKRAGQAVAGTPAVQDAMGAAARQFGDELLHNPLMIGAVVILGVVLISRLGGES